MSELTSRKQSTSQDCPICGLINPAEAQRCDCGYDFASRHIKNVNAVQDLESNEQRAKQTVELLNGKTVFKSTKSPIREALIFFIAFFAAFLFIRELKTPLFNAVKKQDDRVIQTVSEIQKSYSSFLNAANDAEGIPQYIEALDATPKAEGDLGEIERFMKTFLNRIAYQRNKLLFELDAIGWDRILDPDRIKKDKNLTESKLLVQKANEIVCKYKDQTYILLDNVQKEISALNISESIRKGILNGFKEGMKNQQIDAMWDLESKVISEFGNIITLLSARQGNWEIQNGNFLFTYQSDVNTFNSYLNAIQEHVTRQQTIQKQVIEDINNNFNRLKN